MQLPSQVGCSKQKRLTSKWKENGQGKKSQLSVGKGGPLLKITQFLLRQITLEFFNTP